MKNLFVVLFFTLLLLINPVSYSSLQCLSTLGSPSPDDQQASPPKGVVADFQVNDAPYDDGTGLILSWIPLPKEMRIIEYRIYRGISPDSLFHIATMEVDPILGVTSPRMLYNDRDFTDFVSLYSPSKLRKEVQQEENSPLYRAMPKDIEVFTRYLNHYSVLGVIDKNDYYYRSRPVIEEITDEDGNSERIAHAGLPLRSFVSLYGMLLPDYTYYYTVVAVNQQRRFYPYAPITEGTPFSNPPEVPDKFSAVIVTDTNSIQFEWSNPLFNDDLLYRNVYIVSSEDRSAMSNYISARTEQQADAFLSNPGKLILSEPTAFPYSSTITGKVEMINGEMDVIGEDMSYVIDLNEPDGHYFVLSFTDYSGHESFSEITSPRIVESSLLPILPEYRIVDKPNDKGDYNQLQFGQPTIFMTQGSFLNRNRTRIQLNYDYTDNQQSRLHRAVFRFYDDSGNLLQEIDEFYLDKKLRLSLPSAEILNEGIWVEIVPIVSSTAESDLLKQKMWFNEEFGFIEFGELTLNEEVLSDHNYYVYKRSKADTEFRLARVVSPFSRLFDDNIPYETSIFKIVNRFDLSQKLLLVDNTVSVTYERESETHIVTNIFGDEIDNDLSLFTDKVTSYQQQIEDADEEEKEFLEYNLNYYQSRIRMENEHPFLVEANKKTDNRSRMRYLAEIRERERRSFEYILIKSDGNALFTQDDIYQIDGETYLFPTPDWFNKEQLPTLIATLIFGFLVYIMIHFAKKGKEMYIRPIAGLEEIDNAIGRATEMGRPILYVPGIGYLEDIATLASLSILSHVAKKSAEYDTKVIVPVADYIVLPVAMETVREAHVAAGRPDTFDREDIFYISGDQFAFVAGVNGIMTRNKTVVNFFLGVFFAEALIMTETGNSQGAVQIAGSDSVTQIPFFITTCDYTLIGEELYGASAYLSKEPLILGTLKAQDLTKFIILVLIIGGTVLSSFRITFLINAFPSQ